MPLTASQVEPALALWNLTGSLRLINYSENHTFLMEMSGQGAFTLRVHRDGYQSRASIESELAWLEALRRDTDLPVAEPIPGRDGNFLQVFDTGRGPRLAVLFRFIPGNEPTLEGNLEGLFETLGRYAATMHDHAIGWQRPPAFERQEWRAATILDADSPWGDWRKAPGVDERIRPTLDRLEAALWRRLDDYGAGPARYGLIHADMRLGNLLVDGDKVTLIDFDDCGFCWFVYDFAAAISFHETSPAIPALRAAWLKGYQSVRRLEQEDIDAIDDMVMLRRMALLAWIGSHAETRLAQQHMPGFAEGTAELAERYLRGSIWR